MKTYDEVMCDLIDVLNAIGDIVDEFPDDAPPLFDGKISTAEGAIYDAIKIIRKVAE